MPEPLKENVVVWVVMKNGKRCESPPIPGVIASTLQQAIAMRRDGALNAELVPLPEPKEWLLDCFDFSEVAEGGISYRGPNARPERGAHG